MDKQKKHYLVPIEAAKGGINGHSAFYCQVNDIEIYSNNDVDGGKWYMTNGEQADTIWYPTPTAAVIAYFEQPFLVFFSFQKFLFFHDSAPVVF